MQDMKGMYLQAGMYIVYAADAGELRIGRIIEIKAAVNTPSILRIRSVRKDHTGRWEIVKSSGLTNTKSIFGVSALHIPDEVQILLERD